MRDNEQDKPNNLVSMAVIYAHAGQMAPYDSRARRVAQQESLEASGRAQTKEQLHTRDQIYQRISFGSISRSEICPLAPVADLYFSRLPLPLYWVSGRIFP